MNLYQRVILIVGAIIFVAVLLTAPQVHVVRDGAILKAKAGNGLASIIDVSTAAVRGLAVLGATAMLLFAAKGISSKKEG